MIRELEEEKDRYTTIEYLNDVIEKYSYMEFNNIYNRL